MPVGIEAFNDLKPDLSQGVTDKSGIEYGVFQVFETGILGVIIDSDDQGYALRAAGRKQGSETK